jgi:predicted HAD superfamily Cof-like phosphohydrolase
MTDYEKVCEFNKCFDFPTFSDMSDEKCRKLRLDLIEEELDELKIAINQNDLIEQQDACADILYVAYGMAYTYQINSDEVLNNTYKKNTLNETIFKNLIYDDVDKETILNKLYNSFNNLKFYTNEQNKHYMNKFLHDIIYYVYNFQFVCNYDSDKIFKIVHESNMSKLCQTEEEAKLTVQDYEQKFLNQQSPYDSPYYYKLYNGLYVVKNKSTGKALKNINYIKVNLI